MPKIEGADLVKCTFCGKSQKDVKKLIAGPGVYICDECINLCNEIIEEETGAVPVRLDSDVASLPRRRLIDIVRLLDQATGALEPTHARLADEASRLAAAIHDALQSAPHPSVPPGDPDPDPLRDE